MFSNTKKFVRRGMATAAALGMAALGLVAVGAPGASAAPAIDPTATYKIHVVLLSGDKMKNQDGKKIDNVDADRLLKDGKFKLEKGSYDVTTTKGYKDALAAKVTDFTPANPAVESETQVGADGTITFDNLKPGLYRLTQTVASTGYVPAKASLIMIPLTDESTGKWLDEVWVYPKNAKLDKIVKENITDKNLVLKAGSEMKFTISAPIAKLSDTDSFTSFKVFDNPSGALKVDSTHSEIKKVEIIDPANSTAAGVELTATTDYKVVDAPSYGIELTAGGLKKLDANQGKILRVTLTGKVADPMPTDVSQWFLKNSAKSVHTSKENPTETTNETEKDKDPTTKMARVKIINKDGSKDISNLKAEFSIYSCENGSGDPSTTGKPLYENVVAGTETEPMSAGADLCIKQTKAPKGYELGSAIVKAPFTEDAVAQAPKNGAGQPVVSVEYQNTVNSSDILSKLPLTGGAGIALFLIVAAGLLGGAYYYARRNRVRA